MRKIALATARTQAIRLARKIHLCDEQIDENLKEITSLVKASPAAPLLEERGYGPIGVTSAWQHGPTPGTSKAKPAVPL